jgi:hypothetical protein
VPEEPRGQRRFYHLEAEPLAEVEEWLKPFERYWRLRMQAIETVLDEENGRHRDTYCRTDL